MTDLTQKQIDFCEIYIKNGFNGKDAYQLAYDTDNANLAAVEAHKLLKNEKIKEYLEQAEGGYREIMRAQKIGRTQLVKKLWDLTEYRKIKTDKEGNIIGEEWDTASANKALDTLIKLMGDYAPKQIEEIKKAKTKELADKKMNELEEIKVRILNEIEGSN